MTYKELITDFNSFLKHPDLKGFTYNKTEKLKITVQLWLSLLLFMILSLGILDTLIDIPETDVFTKMLESIGYFGAFVFAVFLGPFLEEVFFRLPLRFKISYAIIGGLGVLFYLAFSVTAILEYYYETLSWLYYVFWLLISVVFVVSCVVFQNQIEVNSTKYFPYVFYVLSIIFAFIHIGNFEEFPLRVLLFTPLIVLPQFVLGLGMGYLRIRIGFWYGCLFHVLNNAFAFSLIYFTIEQV